MISLALTTLEATPAAGKRGPEVPMRGRTR
jgi:hypothetical protein